MNAMEALALPPAAYQTTNPNMPNVGQGPLVLVAQGQILALTGTKAGKFLSAQWAMEWGIDFQVRDDAPTLDEGTAALLLVALPPRVKSLADAVPPDPTRN
jgi:hypothetical protein